MSSIKNELDKGDEIPGQPQIERGRFWQVKKVTGDLAADGIAANVIAAYFHDHIFVQPELADQALGILSNYSSL